MVPCDTACGGGRSLGPGPVPVRVRRAVTEVVPCPRRDAAGRPGGGRGLGNLASIGVLSIRGREAAWASGLWELVLVAGGTARAPRQEAWDVQPLAFPWPASP